ncbi:MAG: gluconate 2-dehydrogenase subunit 3 family protein [Burkholderiaceae bacterium]|nr:gluconate 2-dehydrogenase subunit 3 family protein [Burkholderiaceae bacterium]
MSSEVPRRMFLKQVTTASGALTIGVATDASAAQAVAPIAVPLTGYQSLSPDEGAFTEALLKVMCPADGMTPNGVDCGLATFFDRQLAGGFGRGDRLYRQPPVRSGKPQAGFQLPLTPEQFYKAGVAAAQTACVSRFAVKFEELDAASADAFLQEITAGKIDGGRVPLEQWFNELVYPLFAQACFADPLYGGNRGKVFWKLIGYPGLPAFHTQDMVTYRGRPFPGAAAPKSIQDFS